LQTSSKSLLAQHNFQLIPSVTGLHYLSLDTWAPRMYPLGCLSGLALVKITVTDALNYTN